MGGGNLEIVAHATVSEPSSQGPGCQLVKPRPLFMLSLDQSAVWVFGIQSRLFYTSDHFGPFQRVFALICCFSNLSLNPQMFPSAVSNESLAGLGKYYPAPTACLMVAVACYVTEQVQFPHVSNRLWRIWSSTLLLFFDHQFIATIVMYEKPACPFKSTSCKENCGPESEGQEVKSSGAWEKNRWETVRRGCDIGERKQMLWWRVRAAREREREWEGRSRDRKWFGFLTDGSQSRTEIPWTSKPPQLPSSCETVWRTSASFLSHCTLIPSLFVSLSSISL